MKQSVYRPDMVQYWDVLSQVALHLLGSWASWRQCSSVAPPTEQCNMMPNTAHSCAKRLQSVGDKMCSYAHVSSVHYVNHQPAALFKTVNAYWRPLTWRSS